MAISVPASGINNPKQTDLGGHNYLYEIYFVIVFTLSTFSPLLAFWTGVIILLTSSSVIDRKTVRMIGYLCAYAGSVTVASRMTFLPSDDFINYYQTYLDLLYDGLEGEFGTFGTEVGLPIYYFLISRLQIENQIFPLFAVTMLGSSLFVLWIDTYGSKVFPTERYGTLMAISLIFYSFVSVTQLTRQMISLSFLLFAISAVGWRSAVFLGCSILFHQSSLLMYLIFKMANRFSWQAAMLALVAGILFFSYFNQLLNLALDSGVDLIRIESKFSYYADSGETFTAADLSGLKFVALCAISALISAKHMPAGWAAMILYVGVLYILFLPFQLLSLRTFLPFVAVLVGYFLTFMGFRIGWLPISWLGLIYGAYIFFKQFNMDPDYPFELWVKFNWIGTTPFYYFFS